MTAQHAAERARVVAQVYDEMMDSGLETYWDLALGVPSKDASIEQQWAYAGPELLEPDE